MPVTFSSLPVEIQPECIDSLDTATLKSTRLTSRAFRDIATEALFRLATIEFSRQGANKFTALCEHVATRRCIRQINLKTGPREPDVPGDECGISSPPAWWSKRVAEWCSTPLPNLNKLLLDSAYACYDGQCSSLALALDEFFSLGRIDTVTIKHLQDDCQVPRPDFAQLSTKPKKVHLLIHTYSHHPSPDADIEIYHRHALFNLHLNRTWLKPLQTQLTHLTLHCNTYWGIYPRWQPNDLHFPHLKSLALGKWTISNHWQIQFITSHGQTLEQLILTRCPIMHALSLERRQEHNLWQEKLPGTGRGRPPTTKHFSDLRWHTVLPQLASGLPKLKHFSMGHGPVDAVDYNSRAYNSDSAFEQRYTLRPAIDTSRYVIFDGSETPSEWREDIPRHMVNATYSWDYSSWLERETDEHVKSRIRFPDCLHEDQDALQDLLDTIKRRR